MARYFKFHDAAALLAECQRLGLDIRLGDDLSPLFRPVTVGSFRVGNSFCIQPMEGCDGTLDGRPGELTFRRWERFGGGGAKLIWGEATAVVPEGRATPRQLLLNDATAGDFERLLCACRHAHRQTCGDDGDLLVGLQLTHSGRYSYPRPLLAIHDPLLDARTVVDRATGRHVGAADPLIDDDSLKRLTDAYVAAARLAYRVGFQFVDIKQCHRYLLNELLSARQRPGSYGGSLENRTRLARDIFTRLRAEVAGLMRATRLNVFDGVPFRKRVGSDEGEPEPWTVPAWSAWGTRADDAQQPDLTEPLAWIAQMRTLGVELLNVSVGNPYASPHLLRPFEYPPPDGFLPPEHPLVGVDRHFRLTEQVQRAHPDLAVVGSGYSYLQEFLFAAAAANVRDGRVTFPGVGRAALPHPDFVRQLQTHGRLDRKRVCRTFSYCTALMRSKHHPMGQFPTGCPPFDKEVYAPIWREAAAQGKES